MKARFLLPLFFAFSTVVSCFAQLNSSDIKQLHNIALYTGGNDELMNVLARNVRYPITAMKANKIGTVVGILKITKNGEVIEVGTLNKADEEFKDAFERVAKLTKGKWAASNDTAQYFYAVFPIQFKFEGSGYDVSISEKPAYFQEPIIVTASGIPSTFTGMYEKQEEIFVARVNESVQAKKYDVAVKALEALVNLQPLHSSYYKPLVTLNERIGNTSEAEYYREVSNLFAN